MGIDLLRTNVAIFRNLGGALGDCTVDRFSVTSSGSKGSPVICGENSGQHSKFLWVVAWAIEVCSRL